MWPKDYPCKKMLHISVPVDKSEFLAVMGSVNSCGHQDKYEYSMVGLTIAEDDTNRVFPNGVQFDYKIHGDLYRENEIGTGNCPIAYFNPLSKDKLEISPQWFCEDAPNRYVCFKPKSAAKSEAVSGDAMDVNSNLVSFGGLFQVAMFCLVGLLSCLVCFLFVKIRKLKSKNAQQISGLV